MTKKNIILVSIVVVLAGVYVAYFSGWFGPKFIRIEHTVRSLRETSAVNGRTRPNGKPVNTVMFSLQKDYRLTSIKVVPAAEFQTNKYAHPLWHLVSKSGSEPANGFAYGYTIAGMTPSVANAEPDMLQPGVEYRLVVEARSVKGEHDFSVPLSTISRR